MKPVWQALAWTSGVLGAAITGAAVGVVAHSTRAAAKRNPDDPHADEPLGRLRADRQSTVAADDGVPLAVQEIEPADGGAPELTAVLVHGFALDSRCWHFQRRDLPELTDPRVRLVLFDQRSHGRSGHSSKRNSTIEQLGRDLDAVLRATAPKGPIALVGHSMGGMTIMALAEQRPELFRDRVRAVGLIGTAADSVGAAGLPRTWLSRINPVPRGLALLSSVQPDLVERTRRVGDKITWSLIRSLAFGDRAISPAVVDLMAEMIGATTVEVVTDFLETIGLHDRKTALAALRTCEVLVLSGDADRVTPFSPHAEVLAAELPDAVLVRVEGAGHPVMLERPELVTEQLTALLRRAVGK
ncbi:Pimeloyl-ACP methyl ester carboxylesterase [Saccharopolyspora antimicrobica]|uniref:Pimeloyl-ACP methyl ester carboxylesterase n=1 Tax=Saccharopolyspora antimicrobica TaxID=455193 RepID=A0A1I5DFD5_9PSEU|nr:alpha/beta hydrolase [Saccharopolyspora antimicrobica]RKT85138.1 pimeloyl-ACP methyl ester carboxylesterase [Saccharopolyspora antimicrobica]SFN97856.1 Pimeloyl-ACP methyl ester carboxylesterase [Saccharopolyspora antimicrobica]